jgi:ketosteroid isomerase-like protein
MVVGLSEIDNEKVVREMVEVINRHDVEAFLELCADDVVAIYPLLNRYEGKEEWGKDLAHEWETIPDTNLRIMSIISQGNTVV